MRESTRMTDPSPSDAMPAKFAQFHELDERHRSFVAEVSHELRTPLAAIKGFAETLQAEESTRNRAAFLQAIGRHADRLSRLVEQLLDICALQYRVPVPDREILRLAPFVREVAAGLRPIARRRRVTVRVAIPWEIMVRADRDQITQVLQNLIDNAVKFSRPEGRVLIEARRGFRGRVMVSIRDNGMGIKDSDKLRVFERFFRAPAAASVPGVGLGLSIVKQIVFSHGGQIWADGADGCGTTIRFVLPP